MILAGDLNLGDFVGHTVDGGTSWMEIVDTVWPGELPDTITLYFEGGSSRNYPRTEELVARRASDMTQVRLPHNDHIVAHQRLISMLSALGSEIAPPSCQVTEAGHINVIVSRPTGNAHADQRRTQVDRIAAVLGIPTKPIGTETMYFASSNGATVTTKVAPCCEACGQVTRER